MSDSKLIPMTEADLGREIEALKDAAAKSIAPCLTAKFIALSDQGVRSLLLKKLEEGYKFNGIYCLDRTAIPENKYVLFDFDCKPGTLCLIKPAFLVVVNIVDSYVISVINPYIPSEYEYTISHTPNTTGLESQANVRSMRTYLTLDNRTFRDIHVEVSGRDVDGSPVGPFQLNHNTSREVKSRKIDFGNKANYHVKVWKNDAGQPGAFIGEFDTHVRYNLAGNADVVEFIIVDIDGRTYLRAFSVKQVAEIALLLWLA